MGNNFYRDRKIFDSVVDNFPKMSKERKNLVKKKGITYLQPNSLKKFWRIILRAIVSYITLHGRFSRVYTYHFFMLNHFRHNVNISIPFY